MLPSSRRRKDGTQNSREGANKGLLVFGTNPWELLAENMLSFGSNRTQYPQRHGASNQ
jgi:hypothetical protein